MKGGNYWYLVIVLVFLFIFLYVFGPSITGFAVLDDIDNNSIQIDPLLEFNESFLELNNTLDIDETIEEVVNESLEINDSIELNDTLEINDTFELNDTLELNNSFEIIELNNTFQVVDEIIVKNDTVDEVVVKNDFQIMTAPTHLMPILNATNGGNRTIDNLTIFNNTVADLEGDPVNLIYDWRRNNYSIAVLNVACQNNSLNGSEIVDYSMNSFNGSFINNDINLSSGYLPNTHACYFDGEDDYMLFGDKDAMDIRYNWSIEFWLNATNVTEDMGIMRKWSTVGNNRAWMVRIHNQSISLIVDKDGTANDGSYGSLNASYNLTENKFHHIAITYNDTTFIIYIDGVGRKYGTWHGGMASVGAQLTLGLDGVGSRFNGSIQNFMLYNETITGYLIQSHNNSRYDIMPLGMMSYDENWSCSETTNDMNSDGSTLESNNVLITYLGGGILYNSSYTPDNNTWRRNNTFIVEVYNNLTYLSNITYRLANSTYVNKTYYGLTDGLLTNLTHVWYLDNMSNETYYFNATITTVFNEMNNTETRVLRTDNVSPIVNITYPWDYKWVVGTTVSSGTNYIRVKGTVNDSESSVDSCRYTYENLDGTYFYLNCSNGTFDAWVPSGGYGFHRLYVYANDSAGNFGTDNITYRRVTAEAYAARKAELGGGSTDEEVTESGETQPVVTPVVQVETPEVNFDVLGIPLHSIEPVELAYIMGQVTDNGIFLDLGNKGDLNLLFGDKPLIDISFNAEEVKGALYKLVDVAMTPYFWLSILFVIITFFIVVRFIVKDVSLGVGNKFLDKFHSVLAKNLFRFYKKGYYKNSTEKYNYFVNEINKFNYYVGKYRLKDEAILRFNELNNLYNRYALYLEDLRRKEVYELLRLSYERVKLL